MTRPAAAATSGIRRRPAARSYSCGSPALHGAGALHPAASRYTHIPPHLIPDPASSVDLQRRLLETIRSTLDHRGYCPLSITALAARVGFHRQSVSVQMSAMKHAGMVRRYKDADRRFVTVIVEASGGGRAGDAAGEPSPVADDPVA